MPVNVTPPTVTATLQRMERDGLIDKFGADEIQQILSEAFGRWRLSDDG